jgi:hypothetical protein
MLESKKLSELIRDLVYVEYRRDKAETINPISEEYSYFTRESKKFRDQIDQKFEELRCKETHFKTMDYVKFKYGKPLPEKINNCSIACGDAIYEEDVEICKICNREIDKRGGGGHTCSYECIKHHCVGCGRV